MNVKIAQGIVSSAFVTAFKVCILKVEISLEPIEKVLIENAAFCLKRFSDKNTKDPPSHDQIPPGLKGIIIHRLN